MSFQIIEILESQSQGVLAKVSHQHNQVTAVIANQGAEDITVGKSVEAELGYDKILSWKVTDDFDDTQSGIWQEQDGIHLLGRVHNVLDYGDGKTIIDVYMSNGSELFTVDSETLNDIPEANDGLEITVGNLYIYPR
jgi:hypothetical protein